ncbi:protein Mis18-alpha [Osmerus eperlanus]|uniref:protein Mis18-alpha n=1 Tax=Osmerus eperlanus TaxID=29151 RepID=UPI002E0F4B2F
MAQRRNYRQEPLVTDATFTFTTNKDDYEDTVVTENDSKQAEDDNGPPVVFLCGNCRLPVGDSLAWAGTDEEGQILLHRVSDNVSVGKETHISGSGDELVCLVVNLTCQGCCSLLGMVYTSTPKKLDYKRCLFYLNVTAIESYVLGSSDQQVAVLDSSEKPVTLEFKQAVERQLIEMKDLTVSMAQRLVQIEAELFSKKDDVM